MMKSQQDSHDQKQKISLPIVNGQNAASLQELLNELNNARVSDNIPLKVSLLGSIIKKVSTKGEKIKYLEEKFFACQ